MTTRRGYYILYCFIALIATVFPISLYAQPTTTTLTPEERLARASERVAEGEKRIEDAKQLVSGRVWLSKELPNREIMQKI